MSKAVRPSAGPTLFAHDDKVMSIYDWAKILTKKWRRPVSHTVLLNRLRRGWSVEETLSVPIGSQRPK